MNEIKDKFNSLNTKRDLLSSSVPSVDPASTLILAITGFMNEPFCRRTLTCSLIFPIVNEPMVGWYKTIRFELDDLNARGDCYNVYIV